MPCSTSRPLTSGDHRARHRPSATCRTRRLPPPHARPRRTAEDQDASGGGDPCWQNWNRHRWDAARTHPLYADLQRFLGEDFRPYFDSSRVLAAEWDTASSTTPAEVAEFFRTSTSYLYNLVIWEASGNRPRYLDEALPVLRRLGVRSAVDYGCGTGNDTIPLHQTGFDVTGYDFASPSTDSLRWRSRNAIRVREPEKIAAHPVPDVLWLIDTIDHIGDIDDTLGTILSRVAVVVTENLTIHQGHSRKHFHHRRPFDELSGHFGHYGLTTAHTSPTAKVQFWLRDAEAFLRPSDPFPRVSR